MNLVATYDAPTDQYVVFPCAMIVFAYIAELQSDITFLFAWITDGRW